MATENLSLKRRVALAANADLYLEIHYDAAQTEDIAAGNWRQMEGFSVFFSSRNRHATRSRRLAELIGDGLLARGFKPNHYHAKDIAGERKKEVDRARAIYDNAFYVLRKSSIPAVLVECGCIVSPNEDRHLKATATREKIAEAIQSALANYFQRSGHMGVTR